MGIFAKKQPLPDDVDGLLAYAEKAAPADRPACFKAAITAVRI